MSNTKQEFALSLTHELGCDTDHHVLDIKPSKSFCYSSCAMPLSETKVLTNMVESFAEGLFATLVLRKDKESGDWEIR